MQRIDSVKEIIEKEDFQNEVSFINDYENTNIHTSIFAPEEDEEETKATYHLDFSSFKSPEVSDLTHNRFSADWTTYRSAVKSPLSR